MSKIAFFCIPAHGHTNPTLEVVRELTSRGHEVWYYSYRSMQEKIEATGARFISCDGYDMELSLAPEDGARISTDLAFATQVLVETTLALGKGIEAELKAWQPHCIVSDSMAVWGKALARKLEIPFVSSTTTFAFNKQSARTMRQSPGELFKMLFSMDKINKSIKRLQENGYPIKNILDIIQNDNETDTIVYTSPEFQPFADTFSDRYLFVGPSIRKTASAQEEKSSSGKKQIYISLGTVNNNNRNFYLNCIEALRSLPIDGVISVGELTDLKSFGKLPENVRVESRVDQIALLQHTDVFLTHCGMNSVNEALYFQVPLILFPQTTEQKSVASRTAQLGAGVYLPGTDPAAIQRTIQEVLSNSDYKKNAEKIAQSFYRCGGAKAAAAKIERIAET